VDLGRNGRLACLRRQGRLKSLVAEQRWVDPSGEVPQVLERLGRLLLELPEDDAQVLVSLDHRGGEPLLHSQGDELLLGPIMDVALERSRAVVLSGDDASA
jgi:hypothetical protein